MHWHKLAADLVWSVFKAFLLLTLAVEKISQKKGEVDFQREMGNERLVEQEIHLNVTLLAADQCDHMISTLVPSFVVGCQVCPRIDIPREQCRNKISLD